MSVNKVILIGNLGKDPEIFTSQNGNKILHFPLATSETYKDKQGNKTESVEWHNIKAFGKLAEVLYAHAKKGDKLYIDGSIKTNKWEDKDGTKKFNTEIIISQFQFLSPVNRTEPVEEQNFNNFNN